MEPVSGACQWPWVGRQPVSGACQWPWVGRQPVSGACQWPWVGRQPVSGACQWPWVGIGSLSVEPVSGASVAWYRQPLRQLQRERGWVGVQAPEQFST